MVYDCGGRSKNLVAKQIKEAFENKDIVDWLFISHLHNDHINGVTTLLNHCNVKRIVLPALEDDLIVEALLYNYIETEEFDNDANRFIEKLLIDDTESTQITQVESFKEDSNTPISVVDSESIGKALASGTAIEEKRINWRYYPINLSSSNSVSIIENLAEVTKVSSSSFYLNGKLDYKKIRDVVKNIDISKVAKIYQGVFGRNHNSYSMPVVSIAAVCLSAKCARWCHKVGETPMRCLTNCLYTGDFEAKNKFIELQKVFDKLDIDYSKIGILQVPHHGSKHNMDSDMYKSGKICIISANRGDKKHPDMLVIQEIQLNNSIPIVVSENESSIQRFLIPLCYV
jgi:ribonuclease BN (tRNA processing enzyme)